MCDLCKRRVDVDHTAEGGSRQVLFHGEDDFVDQLAGVRARDVRADDLVSAAGADELGEADGCFFCLRAVVGGEVLVNRPPQSLRDGDRCGRRARVRARNVRALRARSGRRALLPAR